LWKGVAVKLSRNHRVMADAKPQSWREIWYRLADP
jgi:hypothetical protein